MDFVQDFSLCRITINGIGRFGVGKCRASMGISASIYGLQKCQPIAGSRLRKYDRLGITEMKLPEVASWG
jgi:hypothetical protein